MQFLGTPPVWCPPVNGRQLKPDDGQYFVDKNAAKYSNYPMEPAVLAVLRQNAELDTGEVDFFTCASVLGNLSRFVRGQDTDFRFIMEKVGNTVFLTRREDSPMQVIPDIRGYGHSFLEEYTSWERDVKESWSHQRIIRYKFGGMDVLVRSECDGFIDREKRTTNREEKPNSLVDSFQNASIDDSTTPARDEGIQTKEGGRSASQESILEVKTRSIQGEFMKADIMPKLWLTQTPTLIIGFHFRGLFIDLRIEDVKEDITLWGKAECRLPSQARVFDACTGWFGETSTHST